MLPKWQHYFWNCRIFSWISALMLRCLLLSLFLLCSSCTLFSTRTNTDETRNKDMVREETHISQEYHDGQIIELKKTVYITEVSKEVAAIKSNRSTSVPTGGMNMTSLLSGGGAASMVIGLVMKKMWDRKPPPKPAQGETIKGRKEEEP